MSHQLISRNDVLRVNPPTSDISITSHGSDWLWTVFCVMVVTDLAVILYTFLSIPRGHRAIHYCSIVILTTASIAVRELQVF